ncbi:MAG: hypothetical protein K2P81_05595 [Bacteriovoracaceae bacterium]|nr:hypothetical protein [Bacteriovoracaceae bacterium]
MKKTQTYISWQNSKLSQDSSEELSSFKNLWLEGFRSLDVHGRMIELIVDCPDFAAELLASHYVPHEDELVADMLIKHLAPFTKYVPQTEISKMILVEHMAWERITNIHSSFEILAMASSHLHTLPESKKQWQEFATLKEIELFENRLILLGEVAA